MELMVLVDLIASRLGMTEEQLGIATLFTILIANLASRLIPDDSTGAMGWAQKIAKVVGLYASNRVTKGVTQNSVIEAMLPVGFKEVEELPSAIPAKPKRQPRVKKVA